MADVGRRSGAALRGFGTVGARPLAALHRHLESAAGWPLAGCAGGLPHPDRRDGGGCGLGGGPRIWRLAESRNGHLGRDQFRAGNPSMAGGACHRHGGLSVFRTAGLLLDLRPAPNGEKRRARRHPGRPAASASSGSVFTSPNWKLEAAISISVYSVLVFVLLRLGLVATMAAVFFIDSFNLISLGADWKTWYAPAGLATFFLLLGIAIFAFWRFARFARVVQRRRESLKEEVRRQKAE